jgi:hypothetical protein
VTQKLSSRTVITGRQLEHAVEEGAGALVLRVADDLVRVSLLDDDAVVHEDHPVRDLAREGHLVGDDDHRHALRGELAHDRQHVADELGVQRRGRLVEEHHLGLHRERARDGHALLLAAGQLTG